MRSYFGSLFVFSALLFLSACDSGGEEGPDPVDPPLAPTTVTYGETVITAATRAFSEAEAAAVTEVSEDRTRIAVTAAAFAADPVSAGDIVVAGPSDAAPDGLLRRVTAISEEEGEAILTTESASLEDVVVEGGVQAEVALADGADPSYVFDLDGAVVADRDGNPSTQEDQGRLDGRVRISSPKLIFGARWSDGDAQEASVALSYQSDFDLNLTWGDVDGGEPVRLELGEYPLQPTVVRIGASPVPIVVTPTLRIALVVAVPPAPSALASSLTYSIDASVSLDTTPAGPLTAASAFDWSGGSASLNPAGRLAPISSQTTTTETELTAFLYGEPFARILAKPSAVLSVRAYGPTWWSATGLGGGSGELRAEPVGRSLAAGEASASANAGTSLGRSTGPLPFDVPPRISGQQPERTSNVAGHCSPSVPRWEVRIDFEDPNGDARSFQESVLHRWRNAGESAFSEQLIGSGRLGTWTPFEGQLLVFLCTDFEGASSVTDEIQLLDEAGLRSNVITYTRANPD